MDKYSRLYCDRCKLIYGIGATGYLKNCTKCGGPLRLKSFNPWVKVAAAVVLIAIGLITIFVTEFPIIWIGAFLWAIGLIFNSFRQWSAIKDLDNPQKSQYVAPPTKVKEGLKDDTKNIVVTCGACFRQYHVRKGQGIIKTRCPNCGRESRIIT